MGLAALDMSINRNKSVCTCVLVHALIKNVPAPQSKIVNNLTGLIIGKIPWCYRRNVSYSSSAFATLKNRFTDFFQQNLSVGRIVNDKVN